MSESDAWQVLKFQPFASAPDVSFWQKLASLKLHQFQLDDKPKVPRRRNVEEEKGALTTSDMYCSGHHGVFWPRKIARRAGALGAGRLVFACR